MGTQLLIFRWVFLNSLGVYAWLVAQWESILLFTGQRNNEFDIYKISAHGGAETRLTTAPGLDDGPEYTPDDKYIYFNSVRSGTMQVWRMHADGSNQEQLTNDSLNNWFPHISPDGKWLAMITFEHDVSPSDHPFYKHMYLRLMSIDGGTHKVIAYLYGGQGNINTPSWSPDGKGLVFIATATCCFLYTLWKSNNSSLAFPVWGFKFLKRIVEAVSQ